MARLEFSSLITDIRGSIGGNTLQRSVSGSIIRNKPSGVNKNTLRQQKARVSLSTANTAWLNLSAANQSLWDKYNQFNPMKQRNNSNKFISASQRFIMYNSIRLLNNRTILEIPIFNLSVPTVRNMRIKWFAPASVVLIVDNEANPLTDLISIKSTPNFSNGINSPGSRFKQIITPVLSGTPVDITSSWNNVYGNFISANTKTYYIIEHWDLSAPRLVNTYRGIIEQLII